MTEDTFYQRLGGAPGLRRLVERFYELMDTLPEARGIRRMHPADLSGSVDKLYKFLSGWSGGPPLYIQEYGHPRLRARHMHVAIGEAERDQWMLCMDRALEDRKLDPTLHRELRDALYQVADFMRNQPAAGAPTAGGLHQIRIRGR
jgi:hemoglobin